METERLLLLPIDVDIIDSFLEGDEVFLHRYGYLNDAGEFLNPSLDYLPNIKARLLEHPEEYPLAADHLIILKEDRKVIGTIYFKELPQNGVAEIGYGMTPAYEGHGLMSEALRAMLRYGKENGIAKVIADTAKDNGKSQNVLKRNGFLLTKEEGEKLYFELVLSREDETSSLC